MDFHFLANHGMFEQVGSADILDYLWSFLDSFCFSDEIYTMSQRLALGLRLISLSYANWY